MGRRGVTTTRIVFDLTPEEAEWFGELVQASGHKFRISLFRALVDVFADSIGFRPRPK